MSAPLLLLCSAFGINLASGLMLMQVVNQATDSQYELASEELISLLMLLRSRQKETSQISLLFFLLCKSPIYIQASKFQQWFYNSEIWNLILWDAFIFERYTPSFTQHYFHAVYHVPDLKKHCLMFDVSCSGKCHDEDGAI